MNSLLYPPTSSRFASASGRIMSQIARQSILPGMADGADVADPPTSEQSPSRPVAECAPAVTRTPPNLTGKSVWVVDANSLIFQVFHALPEMSSPKGTPVSAVFGFTRDVLYLLEEKKPDYLLIAFDRPEPTFRHAAFAGYKDRRSEMPADLRP